MSAALEAELIAPAAPELTYNPSERRSHEYYSPDRKAEVLALLDANEGNIKRTAREANIDHATIRYWIENRDRYRELKPQKLIDLAQLAENNARSLAQSIQDQDLTDVPLNHKATAFGIMVDKMQLLRSQPTTISANVNIESLTITLQQVIAEITSTDSTD